MFADVDDLPIGRVLSRREALALLGSAGALFLSGCATGASSSTQPTATSSASSTSSATASPLDCVARPALTEGPYFVDEKLNRSDIRSDPSDGMVKDGALLRLTFRVARASACTALAGATVDIWHCDAQGIYSDVSDPSFTTTGKKFLRGYQVTDASGVAQFTTIYPGWYQGRAVHIHFKIRASVSGKSYDFTSQLFFDDTLSDQVYAQPPYASKGQRTTRNAQDGIFQNGGAQLLLAPTKDAQGYAATFAVGLQF
jgi:protocatechuate 3,4-dioxygenase beta subunit